MTNGKLSNAAAAARSNAVIAIAIATICIFGLDTIRADEAASEILMRPEPVNCVSLIRIRRTDIVDDHNILFYMNDGVIYQNKLPNRCPGLRIND